jgi:hypothetical protein
LKTFGGQLATVPPEVSYAQVRRFEAALASPNARGVAKRWRERLAQRRLAVPENSYVDSEVTSVVVPKAADPERNEFAKPPSTTSTEPTQKKVTVSSKQFVPWIFDAELDSWRACLSSELTTASAASPSELLFMSYNVWFDAFAQGIRATELLRLMALHNPDVVCLQEMTPGVLDTFIKESKFVKANYVMSCLFGEYFRAGYGVMMLWRRSLGLTAVAAGDPAWCATRVLDFPSGQGRNSVCVDFTVSERRMSVVTVHLESLGYPAFRRDQLEIVAAAQRSVPNALIMGDFNFSDKYD